MIDNLEEKLKGKLPVNREELFTLVSSWGRLSSIQTNDNILIKECKPNECYNLSNLDVSQITNLSEIFNYSPYNGDLSKWDVSSCTNMNCIFYKSKFNNDSLKNWNTSNIKNMSNMFYLSQFNGDISSWNISNVINMTHIFSFGKFSGDISKWEFNGNITLNYFVFDNKNFEKKYNDGKTIPNDSNSFLNWFEANRTKIANLNITKEELVDIDDYISNFESSKKELINGN